MELNPIKIILILLCIFNVAFGETMYHNEKLQIKGKNAQTFEINLEQKSLFNEYISISFKPESTDVELINPFILASTQENCDTDRLYMGTQIYGTIYFFIKTAQIQNKFYICNFNFISILLNCILV